MCWMRWRRRMRTNRQTTLEMPVVGRSLLKASRLGLEELIYTHLYLKIEAVFCV